MDPVAAVWEDGFMAMPPPLPHKTDFDAEPEFDDEPRPKKSAWRTPLIIIGVILGVLLLCILLGVAYIWWFSEDMPIRQEDRDVLVTVAWAQGQGFEVDFDPALELVEKVRYIDKSYELSYEYTGLDAYILCEVTVEGSVSDAKASYVGLKAGQSIVFSIDDTDVRERSDLLRWGDDSKCALLYDDEGILVGNYFTCRSGKRLFSFVLIGLVMEERQALQDFLLPVLHRLKVYEP